MKCSIIASHSMFIRCPCYDSSMTTSHSSRLAVLASITVLLGNIHVTSAVEKVCGMPADIALVLDSSASIFPPDFNKKLMPFLKELVSSFQISPDKVRFSLLTYGHEVNEQFVFNFDEYTDEQSLLDKLDTVHFIRGESTRTDLAVRYARKKFFSTARPNVEKIEIIVTDGRTDDLAIPSLNKEISLTKKDDITIFAIGVGDKISLEDLKSMASSMKYVFTVTNYAALQEIKDILAATACEPPTTPPPKDRPCGDIDPDVIFTMDSSRMNIGDVRAVFEFMIGVVREKGTSLYKGLRIGLLTGQCVNYRGFALGEFIDKAAIGNYLDRLSQAEVRPLVKELWSQAFSVKNGGRSGARRVGVIVVPEKIRDPKGLLVEAEIAKMNDVELYAIGIGSTDTKLLHKLASSSDHVIHVNRGSDLESFVVDFVQKLCQKPKPTLKPTPEPSTKNPNC